VGGPSSTPAQVDTAWVRVWNSDSYGQNIAVDDAGNVYVGGGADSLITVAYNPDGQLLWTRYFGEHDSYVGGPIAMHLNSRGDISLLSDRGAIVRYNTFGDSLWSRRLIFITPQDTTYPVAIVSDDSGNVYVTGASNEPHRWATLKYDRDGILIWTRIFDGHPDYYFFTQGVYDMALDGQGNVIVAGITRIAEPGGQSGITAVKYNSAGDLLWYSRYDSAVVAYGLHIDVDNGDNVYVSGLWRLDDTSSHYRQPILVKFHPNGGTAWARIYGDTVTSYVSAPLLAIDSTGGVCAFGYGIGDSANPYALHYGIAKFTSEGRPAWSRYFDFPGHDDDFPADIEVGGSSAIYVAGSSGVWDSTTGQVDSYIMIDKCSPDGELIWHAAYAGDRRIDEWINHLALDRSENIYVTGLSSPADSDFSDFMLTIKFVQTSTGTNNDPAPLPDGITMSAFPNPFNAQTTISYSLSRSSPVTIDIFNIGGQRVARLEEGQRSAGEHKATWDAGALPSGIYFAQLAVRESRKAVKMILLK
jgi:hypothetical protein